MERRDEMRAIISEQAAEWLLRLKGEKLNSAERLKYVKWLKQSPSHIAEMLRISEVDGLLGVVALTGIVGESPPRKNVLEHPAKERRADQMGKIGREDEPEFGMHPSARGSSWISAWLNWKIATGFSAAAVAIVAGVLVSVFLVNWDVDTEIGVWRRVKLTDGSVVNVGPLSHLSFDFTKKQRNVYLTNGEAIFQVAKNPERPFFVNTDLAVVRAVGTEFGVTRRDDGRVLVTVKEGKVQVMQGAAAQLTEIRSESNSGSIVASAPMALVKDEQIAISPRDWPVRVQSVDASSELAWAQGHLVFDGMTTILQAAQEFNRRNRIQIVIEDPLVAQRQACCVFSVDDPESFAESVATSSKGTIVLLRDGTNTLRLVSVNPGE